MGGPTPLSVTLRYRHLDRAERTGLGPCNLLVRWDWTRSPCYSEAGGRRGLCHMRATLLASCYGRNSYTTAGARGIFIDFLQGGKLVHDKKGPLRPVFCTMTPPAHFGQMIAVDGSPSASSTSTHPSLMSSIRNGDSRPCTVNIATERLALVSAT